MDNTTGRSLLENRFFDRHKTKTIVGPTIRDNNRLLYQQCRTIKTSCRKGEFRPKITIKVWAQLFNSRVQSQPHNELYSMTSFVNANPFVYGDAIACLPNNSLCLRIIWRSAMFFVYSYVTKI